MGHWDPSPPWLAARGEREVDPSPDPGNFSSLEEMEEEELRGLLNDLDAIKKRQRGRLSLEQEKFRSAVETALAAANEGGPT